MARAVVLLGAGASLELGTPSTPALTVIIERQVRADNLMKHTGGDVAYLKILAALTGYLERPGIVHFEQIYHCAHELLSLAGATPRAFDEFRPLMLPFLENVSGISTDALRALADKMVEIIYSEVSSCCAAPGMDLSSLGAFIARLRAKYIPRIYTTNYDDFPLQAVPDLYTGFDRAVPSPKPFELDAFWRKEDEPSLFHLHGSVHMGFPHPLPAHAEIGELFWWDDRNEARPHELFDGTNNRRMDGTGFLRTSVITGLDKLSRLQQRPLSHFYSALARDAMLCDLIFVIGSGLADLHLNTWLHESRSRRPRTPILVVDYWWDGFRPGGHDDRKDIELFHALEIHINETQPGYSPAIGWTVSDDKSAAVWDRGFQAFLNAPDALDRVLRELGYPSLS